MKIAIVQSPASPHGDEIREAVLRVGLEPVEFSWDAPPQQLEGMAGYIIVDSLSEDIAMMTTLNPLVEEIKVQIAAGVHPKWKTPKICLQAW